jgi:hypothetical protein
MHNNTLFEITAHAENIVRNEMSVSVLQHVLPTLQSYTCAKMLKERLAKHKSVTNFNIQVFHQHFGHILQTTFL